MAYYKIIKGWPGEHTLDYQFTPANGVTITPGQMFCVSTAGTAIAGTYDSGAGDAADLHFFCFDVDTITGKVMGIPGNIIVEVDSDSYVTGSTYAVGKEVTCTAGKFDDVLTTSKKVVAKVLYQNTTTGIKHFLIVNN